MGTIINMLLVGVATRLVYLDIRRRAALNAELRDQKLKLEHEVEERTRELVELSTHLQNVSEREKASLARELHDELGGLLVGARMDISWAEQHLTKNDPDLKLRLNRVQQNLAAGVDLKRRIIEELRPTLLDNVGLFAALRWQMKETCGGAGLKCSESYPDEEPRFKSEASIALFRIAQEAFSNILKHSQAKAADISLDMDDETLLLRIADDGVGMPAERFTAIGSHGLASMRHRVRALGAAWMLESRPRAVPCSSCKYPSRTPSRKSASPRRRKDAAPRGSADNMGCVEPMFCRATPRVGFFIPTALVAPKIAAPEARGLDVLNPPDWYPAEHPAMPAVVAHGSPPPGERTAPLLPCALCHLPNGLGHVESASLAGLPADYIIRQLVEFRSGRRRITVGSARAQELLSALKASYTDAQVRRRRPRIFPRLRRGRGLTYAKRNKSRFPSSTRIR